MKCWWIFCRGLEGRTGFAQNKTAAISISCVRTVHVHAVCFNGICRGIAWFDRHIIDGTMDALASMTQFFSLKIKGMQNGSIQTYVIWYFFGALLLAAITWICLL